MPVIQACALERFVGNIKTERSYQMQTAAGSGAGAGDISTVSGYFRFDQNDMKQSIHLADDFPSFSPTYCTAKFE